MTKVLSFDSVFLINPIRKIYTNYVKSILARKNIKNEKLVLIRQDKENIFLFDDRNISGIDVGYHQSLIDSMSINFYKNLETIGICDHLEISNEKLYKLYTRQVKLKLFELLKVALRIKKISKEISGKLEIVTDRQTASIMEEAFLFLDFNSPNIIWRINGFLTFCISINAILMRFISLVKMILWPSDLPNYYFTKNINSNLPTVLITLPKRKPEDFLKTYIDSLSNKFNIILYSQGKMLNNPEGYKRIKIKNSVALIKGSMNYKSLFGNSRSYIADIILVFSKHFNLNRSINAVDSIFLNKIDAHISRLQTNVLDNYLAIESKRNGVYVLGDVMEEIFYCDSAVCSSKADLTESLKLSMKDKEKITIRGSNSLIKYRLSNFNEIKGGSLKDLLQIDNKKKVIFYASDPSKEQRQRYLTENFLIKFFSNSNDYNFVVKTHPQDNGNITNHAYLNSPKSSNIFLLGDEAQKNKMASSKFIFLNNFNFNSAIASCDGFLTFSSSSILQAIKLGVKTGIVDIFNNGYYDYLINHNASFLIKDQVSLTNFLDKKKFDVSNQILDFCGLGNDSKKFNIGSHLYKLLKDKEISNENNIK